MSFKTVKLKWAKKLLHAKMFVILTEKESAIAIDGADPYSFTDALALAAQSAELEMFHQSLGNLVKDHQAALAKLSGEPTNEAKQATPEQHTTDVADTANAVTPAASRKTNASKSTKATTKQSRPVRASVRGSKKPTTKAKTAKK